MKTATVGEIQKNFSRILKQIKAGEEIAVTRRGKPVAKITAIVLLAAFIAIITSSPLRWLTRKRVPKWLALSIIVIVLFEAGSILILVFTGELETFSSGLPSLQERFVLLSDRVGGWLEEIGLPSASEALKDIFDPAILVSLVRLALSNVSGVFGTGLLILLAVIFMLPEASGLPALITQTAAGCTWQWSYPTANGNWR
jgi:antitoxin (DNA-binding transcriptional repressor) of toxin-antitoxin stability system